MAPVEAIAESQQCQTRACGDISIRVAIGTPDDRIRPRATADWRSALLAPAGCQ
jgi:hypothetical protein